MNIFNILTAAALAMAAACLAACDDADTALRRCQLNKANHHISSDITAANGHPYYLVDCMKVAGYRYRGGGASGCAEHPFDITACDYYADNYTASR
jgi:hypothetical protein